jgi:HNH endonuclease
MPFTEANKLQVKRRAHFSCIICHQPFVEVHHIIPQAAGGTDDLENVHTCPADRVLGLFEQETGIEVQRIAKKVKQWFTEAATKAGWAGGRFVPEVQSAHGAGAILLNPLSVKITVNQIVIQLPKDGDDDEG